MNSCTMVTVRKVGTIIIRGEDIQYMSVMWSVQRDQELDILHIRKQDIPRLMDRWIALVIVWPMDVQMMNCGPISIHIASSKNEFRGGPRKKIPEHDLFGMHTFHLQETFI